MISSQISSLSYFEPGCEICCSKRKMSKQKNIHEIREVKGATKEVVWGLTLMCFCRTFCPWSLRENAMIWMWMLVYAVLILISSGMDCGVTVLCVEGALKCNRGVPSRATFDKEVQFWPSVRENMMACSVFREDVNPKRHTKHCRPNILQAAKILSSSNWLTREHFCLHAVTCRAWATSWQASFCWTRSKSAARPWTMTTRSWSSICWGEGEQLSSKSWAQLECRYATVVLHAHCVGCQPVRTPAEYSVSRFALRFRPVRCPPPRTPHGCCTTSADKLVVFFRALFLFLPLKTLFFWV